jgi:hypothetical protein
MVVPRLYLNYKTCMLYLDMMQLHLLMKQHKVFDYQSQDTTAQ